MAYAMAYVIEWHMPLTARKLGLHNFLAIQKFELFMAYCRIPCGICHLNKILERFFRFWKKRSFGFLANMPFESNQRTVVISDHISGDTSLQIKNVGTRKVASSIKTARRWAMKVGDRTCMQEVGRSARSSGNPRVVWWESPWGPLTFCEFRWQTGLRSRFVHNFGTCLRTYARWKNPRKKRVSTQEKSDFAMVPGFSKRKNRSCAQI